MQPFDEHQPPADVGVQTVPDALLGCWRRNWIRFGDDGELDRSVQVIWLQTASGMGDLRIDPTQTPEQSDSSCGITVVDETTSPHPTADWMDGDTGFAQQPVSSFPEKGWLRWESPTIMHELAPSGAYVEEWERLDNSAAPVGHWVAANAPTRTNLYWAGRHVFLATQRPNNGAIDEFSYGHHRPDSNEIIIELSTVAAKRGTALRLGHDQDYNWQLVSFRSS